MAKKILAEYEQVHSICALCRREGPLVSVPVRDPEDRYVYSCREWWCENCLERPEVIRHFQNRVLRRAGLPEIDEEIRNA